VPARRSDQHRLDELVGRVRLLRTRLVRRRREPGAGELLAEQRQSAPRGLGDLVG
jgi:hypothetical protein